MHLALVTGPVRSGKSTLAAKLASERGRPVVYLATAPRYPEDDEWLARIEHHAARRPAEWEHHETATWDEAAWEACCATSREKTLLVDSLGGWLTARMDAHREQLDADPVAAMGRLDAEAERLAQTLAAAPGAVISVSEQTGWGVVPAYASGRVYTDVLGRLERRIALDAAHAYLVVAGFAVELCATGVKLTESD